MERAKEDIIPTPLPSCNFEHHINATLTDRYKILSTVLESSTIKQPSVCTIQHNTTLPQLLRFPCIYMLLLLQKLLSNISN
jgi:hypothetical protein